MIKFGTGGWRAVIGDEFTKTNIQIVAKAMSLKLQNEGISDFVIGYDRRFLSRESLLWFCEVLNADGIKCYFVNRSVPTPLVMYHIMKEGFDYGAMITASHNTSLYNGIKIFTKGGRDASEEQTKDIEKYIEEAMKLPKIDTLNCEKAGDLIEEIYPMNSYIDNIIENIDMKAIQEYGIKVALDPMFGVSKTAISMILLTARCDLDIINEEHDTLFGGKMPSPSKETLGLLQYYVMDKKFDIGIATDGDADRLGVIDDKGRFLHPNDILICLYYYLSKYKGWRGPVVRNIATTHTLDKIAEHFGEKCYEVPVGFKNISSKMMETGAIIGGESSGGLTVDGHINGKDGVYAAALLIEMISKVGKKLSEIVDDIESQFGKMYMEERGYTFSEEKKQEINKILFVDKKVPEFDSIKITKVSYADGFKIYFDNGGFMIARFSGTEPLIRIFCEMETEQKASDLIKVMEKMLDL